MALAGYTIGEIVWLRSLTAEEALRHDQAIASSFPSAESGTGVSASEDPVLPAVVRRREVEEAIKRIPFEKRDKEILTLLSTTGMTEEQVAERIGLDQSTISRRYRAKLEEIQTALGGPPTVREAKSIIPPCIRCQTRPRARAYALRRVKRTYWEAIEPERELSHCAVCLPVEARDRVLLRKKDLVHVHKRTHSMT